MPAVSSTRSGAQEAPHGIAEARSGAQEAPHGIAEARSGAQAARGGIASFCIHGAEEATLGAATGGGAHMLPSHPFNVTAPMAGMMPAHLFNTLGNPSLSAVHVFTVTPPARDYSQKVHTFSSRVEYTGV